MSGGNSSRVVAVVIVWDMDVIETQSFEGAAGDDSVLGRATLRFSLHCIVVAGIAVVGVRGECRIVAVVGEIIIEIERIVVVVVRHEITAIESACFLHCCPPSHFAVGGRTFWVVHIFVQSL